MSWFTKRRRQDDAGMVTAEYAVGTVAAAGFGCVLYELLSDDSVLSLLSDLVGKALRSVF